MPDNENENRMNFSRHMSKDNLSFYLTTAVRRVSAKSDGVKEKIGL
jgi:hypothetical protein